LYTLTPYDRSIWVQIKSPSFLLLKAISIFPPPIQPMFFIIQFVLMDHWDEFLLVRFILLFKSETRATRACGRSASRKRGVPAPLERATGGQAGRQAGRRAQGGRRRRAGVGASTRIAPCETAV
jgi:hypothetical protein